MSSFAGLLLILLACSPGALRGEDTVVHLPSQRPHTHTRTRTRTHTVTDSLGLVTLSAQVRSPQCYAPRLDGGYFIPHRLVFDNGSTIIYACDEGHKPVADRWFVTSTCSDGDWSPRPLCVGECAVELFDQRAGRSVGR